MIVGVCVVCFGIVGPAPGPTALVHIPPVAVSMRAPDAGHDDQPHQPELAEAQPLPGPVTEIRERHPLILDHPIYGQLDGNNYLAYCDACPLAAPGLVCLDLCPGQASPAFNPAALG